MKHIHLEETNSTNSYLRELIRKDPKLDAYTYVTTYEQTSGRGQSGNSWEAEPGKNISLSLLLRPEKYQDGYTPFDLNIVSSLSLYDFLAKRLPSKESINVKWPNDILIDGRKIAGILTENEWMGDQWEYAIVGIGLNVFQTQFGAYRPEATSLMLEADIKEPKTYEDWHHSMTKEIVENFQSRFRMLSESPVQVRREYLSYLYRYQEENAPFRIPNGRSFEGTIIGVEPNGLLVIKEGDETHHFAFKEVQFR